MSETQGATPPPKHTALWEFHRRHGAHLVPFAGYEMPLYYSSIVAEHKAVRSSVGLFDVSHMGILTAEGARAGDLLARRTTANVPSLVPGQVRYTFLLESTGHIVDDLLVSRLSRPEDLTPLYGVVPNASRADEIEEILRQHRTPDTKISRWNSSVALLALQGPGSRALLSKLFGWDLTRLAFYHVGFFPRRAGAGEANGRLGLPFPAALSDWVLVSRTGYTGEIGYELFVPNERADALAEELLAAGALPCGLGARDTLRLEKGYLLSGQEFHRDRSPLEAGQDRFVDFDHEFVGRPELEKQRGEGLKQRLAGIEVRAPGAIPRHGTPVRSGDAVVAQATSGGPSPVLGRGLALAYLPRELGRPGTTVGLEIRGREVPGEVVPLPFVKTSPAA